MTKTPKTIEFDLPDHTERDLEHIMSSHGIKEKQLAIEKTISIGILSVERKILLRRLAVLEDMIDLEVKNINRYPDPELIVAGEQRS